MTRPCLSMALGVLGYRSPTLVQCGGLHGHDGPHSREMSWRDDRSPNDEDVARRSGAESVTCGCDTESTDTWECPHIEECFDRWFRLQSVTLTWQLLGSELRGEM